MMTRGDCQRVRDLLDDHLNGELTVETMRDIVAHLERCQECRMELDRRQAVRAALKRQLDTPMPPSLRDRVFRVAMAEPTTPPDVRGRPRSGVVTRMAVLLAPRWPAALGLLRPWPVPIAITLAIVALLVLQFGLGEAPVTAAELLARSTRLERESVVPQDSHTRRVLMVEERVLPAGTVVERRRVELWQNGRTGVAVRRAFDEGSRLLASERKEQAGGRMVYRRGAAATRAAEAGDNGPSVQQLLTARDAWRLNLSAAEFLSVVPPANDDTPLLVSLSATATEYELTYQPAPDGRDLGFAYAALTLRRTDLRPVREVLATRHGPGGNDVREFRVVEETYETLPAARVPDTVFETDASLLVLPAIPLAISPAVPPSRRPPLPLFRGLSVGSEVELLYELHRADACLHEGTAIRREGDTVEVRAIVSSEAERPGLLRALSEVDASSDATVRVEVRSPEAIWREGETRLTGTPGADALRRYFTEYVQQRLPPNHQVPLEEIQRAADEAAVRVVERLRQRTAAARRHAVALRALVDRFTSAQPDGLDLEQTLTWQTMIRDHARGVRRETETIRLELEPISFASGPRPSVVVPSIDSANLTVSVSRLLGLTEAHDRTVQRAFGVSAPLDAGTAELADPALWQSLLETEALAQEFDRPWSLGPHR